MSGDRLRLDKWLWHARFLKTRSMATRYVAAGRLRVNGERVEKPHHAVKPGDVLTFPLGPRIRIVEIVALGSRRGPAKEAQALYNDMSPPPPPPDPAAAPGRGGRAPGSGRPTKRERREIDRLTDRLGEE